MFPPRPCIGCQEPDHSVPSLTHYSAPHPSQVFQASQDTSSFLGNSLAFAATALLAQGNQVSQAPQPLGSATAVLAQGNQVSQVPLCSPKAQVSQVPQPLGSPKATISRRCRSLALGSTTAVLAQGNQVSQVPQPLGSATTVLAQGSQVSQAPLQMQGSHTCTYQGHFSQVVSPANVRSIQDQREQTLQAAIQDCWLSESSMEPPPGFSATAHTALHLQKSRARERPAEGGECVDQGGRSTFSTRVAQASQIGGVGVSGVVSNRGEGSQASFHSLLGSEGDNDPASGMVSQHPASFRGL